MKDLILFFLIIFAARAQALEYCWAKCFYRVPGSANELQSRQMVVALTTKQATYQKMVTDCSKGNTEWYLVKIEDEHQLATVDNICDYSKEDLDRIFH